MSSRAFSPSRDPSRSDADSRRDRVGPLEAGAPSGADGASRGRDHAREIARGDKRLRYDDKSPRKRLKVARQRVGAVLTRPRYYHLARGYSLPDGSERVYHYHVRKSAGTSLNRAFWELGGESGPAVLRRMKDSPLNRTISNGLVIVRHNQPAIEQGLYFFANSHLPAHQLQLPERTFTVTILRDPLDRLLSHYRYLRWLEQNEPQRATFRREGGWLGSSFSDFMDRLPREHLEAQLYMFSAGFDVAEALEGLQRCSAVLFTESFQAGVRMLADRLGLELQEQQERRYDLLFHVSDRDRCKAQELLADEYRLLEASRAHWSP